MVTFTRNNAWNQNGTFSNPDLLWYAKAVKIMLSRSIDDQTSWSFYAAIHGEYLINKPPGYPNWGNVPLPPAVSTTPLPSNALIKQYWDQCQHGSWFFSPWHRGYLYAIENILRDIVIDEGGPDAWALPYWNYFGTGQDKIPPAFTLPTLPDGSPNPLLVDARYGPNNNKQIFIPLAGWNINQNCQGNTDYTGVQPDYYGGDVTGFAHSKGVPGALEWNPHNPVHSAIGGQNPTTGLGGLMSRPSTAALDPVFYLHHCNIDRMWAAWTAAGNSNPTDPNWLNGPTATGDRKFYMPKPDKTPWQFTPKMVNDISQLNYTYDNLSLGVIPASTSKNIRRMRRLGLQFDEVKSLNKMNSSDSSQLIGANNGPVLISASGTDSVVKLDSKGWNKVTRSIENAAAESATNGLVNNLPDEVYLQLEGIKGNEDSIVCTVSVNHQYIGHISLFGLQNASTKDNAHGGTGLTIRLDITKVVDELQLKGAIDINSLNVLIQPVNLITKGNDVTIDRISIYRK